MRLFVLAALFGLAASFVAPLSPQQRASSISSFTARTTADVSMIVRHSWPSPLLPSLRSLSPACARRRSARVLI
jgi:hypothetical protein